MEEKPTSLGSLELLDLVWGIGPIADAIGRTKRQTQYALERGILPAKKVGGRWVIERRKLHDFFLGDAA